MRTFVFYYKMSSIYIHIPFCHHKCTYCDFHFSVNTSILNKLLSAILIEIEQRKEYLGTQNIETIYFGGGTPSLLSVQHLEKILNELAKNFSWNKNAEITIECNPEDININYLYGLKSLGINRISLGMQSLNDEVLKWMGRKHSASQSIQSIKDIHKTGFVNFSTDIIFGIPFYLSENLKRDIEVLLSLSPPHISAYQLTIEPKTKFNYLVRKKKIHPASDEKISSEFLMIQELLMKKQYLHYEVSNYAQEGFIAQHNSSYWLQKKYLGIGPSAHSYNGIERRWNVANNYLYVQNIETRKNYYETEILNINQRFNEYVYTRLRTMYGCNTDEIKNTFGDTYKNHFLQQYNKQKEYFDVFQNTYKLKPEKGYLLADKFALEFFIV